MAEVGTLFGLAALVIFVGFLSTVFFERTRLPDVLILILLGILLGPLSHLLRPDEFASFIPVFEALALTLILFDGGLDLKYEEVVRKSPSTFVLLVTAFVLTTLAVSVLLVAVLPGIGFSLALAFGALLSAVSAPIVVPLLSIMAVKPETKAVLNLESALADAAAIMVVFALLGSLGGTGGAWDAVLVGIAATIFFSTVIALVLGVLWLELLRTLQGRAYAYMITLAVVLGLYSLTELLGGAGAVAALVFGIVLANGKQISRHLPVTTDFVLDEKFRWFQSEVTFVLKTFFFVYVGLIFTPAGLFPPLLGLSLAILGVLVGARALAVRFLVAVRPEEREDQDVLLIMMPRGLTSVVLVALVTGRVGTEFYFLIDIALTVIILTNAVVTVGVFTAERRRMRARSIPAAELEAARP